MVRVFQSQISSRLFPFNLSGTLAPTEYMMVDFQQLRVVKTVLGGDNYKNYLPMNYIKVRNNSTIPLALFLDGIFVTNLYKESFESGEFSFSQFRVLNVHATSTLAIVDLQVHVQKQTS